jgi:hypothetical protein
LLYLATRPAVAALEGFLLAGGAGKAARRERGCPQRSEIN